MSSEFLTLEEVAGMLRVSYDTVWRAVRSGELEARRVGRAWRVTPAAVDAWTVPPARPDRPRDARRRSPSTTGPPVGSAARLRAIERGAA